MVQGGEGVGAREREVIRAGGRVSCEQAGGGGAVCGDLLPLFVDYLKHSFGIISVSCV